MALRSNCIRRNHCKEYDMIEIRPLAPKIGAEILHADARSLDDEAFKAIYQAFLDHVLVLIRGQHLTEREFLDWSARFGPLKPHIAKTAHHAQYPEMVGEEKHTTSAT